MNSTKTTPKATPSKSSRLSANDHLDEATRMAKALSHPLRTKVLVRLNETVASPNELATELGEPLGNVSYHVRALLELHCIELVKTAQRRGAIEHYYRATRRAWGDDSVWELLPPRARHGFAVEWFKQSFEDARDAVDDGGFERRTECKMFFTKLDLDAPAWRKLAKRMDALLDYALELQAESAGRLDPDNPESEIKARVILAQYEKAHGSDGESSRQLVRPRTTCATSTTQGGR